MNDIGQKVAKIKNQSLRTLDDLSLIDLILEKYKGDKLNSELRNKIIKEIRSKTNQNKKNDLGYQDKKDRFKQQNKLKKTHPDETQEVEPFIEFSKKNSDILEKIINEEFDGDKTMKL